MADEIFKINRKTLRELIDHNRFHIPDFQRDFKWGQEDRQDADVDEFKIFLTDLKNSYENRDDDKEYYIGTLITYEEEDTNRLQIIDGQQRVSSIHWILLGYYLHLNSKGGALLDDIDEPKDILRKKKFGGAKNVRLLTTSDQEADKYLDKMFEGETLVQPQHSESTKNQHTAISQSLKFFNENVGENYNERFITYLLDNVVVAHVEASGFRQAFIVFERMNDRGRELSVPDKIKYHIMKKYSKTETLFKNNSETISIRWRKVSDQFNNDDSKFTTFLMHYFTAVGFFSDDDDSEWYSEKEVVHWFRRWVETQDAVELLKDMEMRAKHYLNFLDAKDNRKSPKPNIDLAYRRRFFKSVRQPLPMLLAASEASIKDFQLVCRLITKLCLVMAVTNESWQKIRTGKSGSIESYIRQIRKGDFEGFQKNIEEFFELKSGKFQQNIVQEGFFDESENTTDLRKFLIVLMENILRVESGAGEEVFIDDDLKTDEKQNTTQNLTAEHILPKNNEEEALMRSVPGSYKDGKEEFNIGIRDIKALIGRFGNFTALDRVSNGALGDLTVQEKFENGAYNTTHSSMANLLVRDYITTKNSPKQATVVKNYHFKKIKLKKINDKEYFLLEHIELREHMMLNILSKYLGKTLTHPNIKNINCSYCK